MRSVSLRGWESLLGRIAHAPPAVVAPGLKSVETSLDAADTSVRATGFGLGSGGMIPQIAKAAALTLRVQHFVPGVKFQASEFVEDQRSPAIERHFVGAGHGWRRFDP